MNTTVSKQRNQRSRIARSAKSLSCAGAIAILMTWAPASIAGADEARAPDSAQTQAAPPSAPKSDADERGYPDRTLCAQAQESERGDETVDTLGCGLSLRFAAATPAGSPERVEDIDHLLALHVQTRYVIPYDDQLLPGLSRMLADRT
jgi:hypothetical protein